MESVESIAEPLRRSSFRTHSLLPPPITEPIPRGSHRQHHAPRHPLLPDKRQWFSLLPQIQDREVDGRKRSTTNLPFEYSATFGSVDFAWFSITIAAQAPAKMNLSCCRPTRRQAIVGSAPERSDPVGPTELGNSAFPVPLAEATSIPVPSKPIGMRLQLLSDLLCTCADVVRTEGSNIRNFEQQGFQDHQDNLRPPDGVRAQLLQRTARGQLVCSNEQMTLHPCRDAWNISFFVILLHSAGQHLRRFTGSTPPNNCSRH